MLFGSALRAFTTRYGNCDDLENIEKIYALRWWYTGSAPQEQCLKLTQYLPQPSTVVSLQTYHPYFTFYTFFVFDIFVKPFTKMVNVISKVFVAY